MPDDPRIIHAAKPTIEASVRCHATSGIRTWRRKEVTCQACQEAMIKWNKLHGFPALAAAKDKTP